MINPDFSIENHGSILLLRPHSDAGKTWLSEHIGKNNGYQPYWPTVVIETRYAASIVDGITIDGLVIQ
jgi:hypothetical protein